MTTLRAFVLAGAVCLRRFLPRALLLGTLIACCVGARAASVAFTYTLPAASVTSAGAYRTDGTLVRTLWNNEPRPAGATTTAWDGLDDSGHPVASGAYQIKVLAHNVTYTWEGYIGNTSTQQTGPTTQRSFLTIRGMAIAGSAMFPVYGYNEKRPLWSRLSTSDPYSVAVWGTEDFTRKSLAATTDGVLVYYTFSSSSSIASQPSFVAAYKVSDNSAHLFANGVPAPQLGTSPTKFPNVIDLQNGSANVPSGIAVQPGGAYLFVAHRDQNLVRVFNKTSGAAIGSFAVTAPTGLVATADGDVWAICTEGGARVVRRYDVDGAGALVASTAVLAGLSNPLALAVSPDNTTLLVADGGVSQQVKAFANASSGTPAASWTLGLAGGYNAVNGPDIAATKFSFIQNWWNDTVPDSWWDDGFIEATWLAYQPDGSFWVSDPGNERHLHFSAGRAYLGQIAYPTVNYVATVCDAAPTRIFAKGWLEYAVDYSQTAQSGWTFVKNWSSGLPDNLARVNRGGFRSVVMLAGRTYGVVHNSTTGKRAVLELPANGIARQTGIEFDATRTMHEDGSLRWQVFSANRTTIYKQDFAGLDGSGNPTWGAAAVLATTPLREMDPADSRVLAPVGPRFPTTSSNMVISNNTTSGWVYHLGGINAGGGAWAWRAAPPGWYYDGHGVVGVSVYPVNTQFVKGRNILFGCHGEFYSGGQANQFMHFWDNGLLVGQFGSPGFGNPLNSVVAGVTGNAFSPYLTQANGVLYAWVNDEWGTGMHRWRIDNTASIGELTPINVTVGATGGNGSGLTGQYFTGTNLDTLTATRTDPTVNFTWSGAPLPGVPADNFSVRWSGLVQPLHSEAYTFYTQSDNGVRLWIDGQKVIDNWTSHSSVENASAPIPLSAGGLHRVVVEFYDGTGGAVAQLKWSSASQAKQVIPMQQLYPSGTQAYNCGGPAVGRFQEDINGTTGSAMVSTANAIDLSGVADPAPMAVYQRQRKFATEYAFFDLKPFANHRVRLHVAEIVPASFAAGARVFPVGVNELGQISPSVDPYALAGGAGYKAAVREFIATADNTGVIRVDFPSNTYSLLAAIEVELDPSSAATSPAFARSGVGSGLKGRYFMGTAFDTFVGSRGDPEVNFTWGTTSPFTGVGATNYTVRWTGKVQTINEGSYGFSVNANAGKRLWVNNQLLIDSWNTSGNHSGTITLSGSTQYDMTLEYVNRTGSSSVDLRWKRPGDSIFRLLPMSQLYPEPEFETILDNTSGSGVAFNGAWTLSTSGVGQYGASYHHDGNTGKGTRSVVYTPTLPTTATYAVYVRYAAATNRSTATPVIVTHAGGTTTVNVDQTTAGGVWVPVGSYGFTAGTGGNVTISNAGTTGYVIADAVRFVKQ